MKKEEGGTSATPRPLELPRPTGDARLDALAKLLAIVDRLRAPDGCPWDREQTVASMAPSLVEEAFEAVETIDRADDHATTEELGDLLMVVALVARIASESGRFDLGEAAAAVSDKLVRRHPHVFGDVEVDGAETVVRNWETIKQAERRKKADDASALAGVPAALPALQRADRIGAKAISAGFRWTDVRGAERKLAEEVGELARELEREPRDPARLEAELGDVLLAAAFLGRYLGIDPERAARGAVRRFDQRFRRMEALLGAELRQARASELAEAWERAKRESAP